MGIAVKGPDFVYVVDSHNYRVQVFTAAGKYLGKWGAVGVGNGQFKGPRWITASASGNISVTDIDLYNVQVFAAGYVPDAPVLSVSNNPSTDGNVTTTWTPAAGAENYSLYRYTSLITGINDSVYSVANVTGTSYNDTHAANGTFYYILVAVNATGTSDVSNCVEAVVAIVKPPPTILEILLGVVGVVLVLVVLGYVLKKSNDEKNESTSRSMLLPTANAPVSQLLSGAEFLDDDSPVEISRQYEHVAGTLRVKVKVLNDEGYGLLRVQVTLNLPPAFRLLRIEPPELERDGPVAKFNDILSGEEKSAAWVLEPLACGKMVIHGTATGVDPWGTPFATSIKPLEVEIRCPLFVTPAEMKLEDVQQVARELPVNNQRVFLLPPTLSPADAFEVAQQVIAQRDVRHVGTQVTPGAAGFDRSAWYYGRTKVNQARYVLRAEVSEADRVIRIATACDEEAGCTGFLAEAGASIRRELVSRGAAESEDKVRELYCEKCGTPLPRVPTQTGEIRCPHCNAPWRVGDFA